MNQRISGLIHLLDTHGPTPLASAARLLGTTPETLRAEVQAFADVEATGLVLDPLLNIEPAGGWPDDGPDPDPSPDDVIRFCPGMAGEASGILHQDASVLGPLLAAATQLRAMEPDNLDLAAATDKLTATLMRGAVGMAAYRAQVAAELQRAAASHQQLQIVYSNAWQPRVGAPRVIDPYRVVATSRGYELDAGPLDELGRPRTYLVPRIRDFQVLESTFDPPAGLAAALAANRRLVPVTGYATHSGLWAIRHFAERVELGRADAEGCLFTAWLLPPVADRAGLMMLLAGCDSYLEDAELDALRDSKAAELASHHRLAVSTSLGRWPHLASHQLGGVVGADAHQQAGAGPGSVASS